MPTPAIRLRGPRTTTSFRQQNKRQAVAAFLMRPLLLAAGLLGLLGLAAQAATIHLTPCDSERWNGELAGLPLE